MSKEAMKQWADDVSKAYDILAFGHTERAAEILAKTRNAMREALAEQPEQQEPVAGVVLRDGQPTLLQDKHIKETDERLFRAAPPAQQEPVAWMFQHEETGRTMCVDAQQVEWGFEKNNPRLKKIAPLYTFPPAQRTWVGLTDEEADELWESTDSADDWELMKRTEAKLKEKNT